MSVGLLLAGAVSGAGRGVQKGLETFQANVGMSALQQERHELELERLRLTEGYAAAREQRGYEHAENLAQQQIEAQKAMHQESLGTNVLGTSMQLQTQRELKHDELAQRADESEKDRSVRMRQIESEEKRAREHNKTWKEVWDIRRQPSHDPVSGKAPVVAAEKLSDLANVYKDAVAAGDEAVISAAREKILRLLGSDETLMPIVDPVQQPRHTAPPQRSTTAPSTSSQPRRYTQDDVRQFLDDMDRARQAGTGQADIVNRFKSQFGTLPTQRDIDAINEEVRRQWRLP